jgi:hypothetical protein
MYVLHAKSNKDKLTEVGFFLTPISVNPPWADANPAERTECNDCRMEFRRSRRSKWRWRDLLYQKPAANTTNRRAAPTVPNTATVTTSSLQLRGSIRTLGSAKKRDFNSALGSEQCTEFDSLYSAQQNSYIISQTCDLYYLLLETYIFKIKYLCLQTTNLCEWNLVSRKWNEWFCMLILLHNIFST